jgi:hypothetical protein
MTQVEHARKALALCQELREELAELKLYSPMFPPGQQSPSAADACAQLLEVIEYHIRQIEVFVGLPKYWAMRQ